MPVTAPEVLEKSSRWEEVYIAFLQACLFSFVLPISLLGQAVQTTAYEECLSKEEPKDTEDVVLFTCLPLRRAALERVQL